MKSDTKAAALSQGDKRDMAKLTGIIYIILG